MRAKSSFTVAFLVGLGLLSSISQAQSDSSPTSTPADSQIIVYGAVRNPSRFEARRNVRLLEVLNLAGGPNEKAAGSVQVIHTNPVNKGIENSPIVFELYNLAEILRGDENSNPFIEPGDLVIVTVADPIYVTGSVINPQAVYLRGPLTLTRAIAMVGGVTRFAKTDRIRIYRQSAGNVSTEITVDLKAISKQQADDLLLQPFDIVEVPDVSPHSVPIPGNPIFDAPIFRDLPLRAIRRESAL